MEGGRGKLILVDFARNACVNGVCSQTYFSNCDQEAPKKDTKMCSQITFPNCVPKLRSRICSRITFPKCIPRVSALTEGKVLACKSRASSSLSITWVENTVEKEAFQAELKKGIVQNA